MASLPLTGTIGATSAGPSEPPSSTRRSLPESVIAFSLPTKKRPESPQKPTRRKSHVPPDPVQEDEDVLSIEESLVLVQSLRQSRLTHLTAMLPYFSTRHRTSTKYHTPPDNHPYPGGLDPTSTPHTLLHLGRADIRVGPLLFPRTRFGEVKVEGIHAGPRANPPPTNPAPASTSHSGTVAASNTGTGPTSKAATVATPHTESATIPNSGTAAKQPASAPGSSFTVPPINDRVVQAVSSAAQNNAGLQRLLQAAANGKATPEELRELANFISTVSETLDKKKSNAARTASAPTSPMTNKSVHSTQVPSAHTQPIHIPTHHPIVTLEFRENPSARFVVPLWRHSLVERRIVQGERSIRVTLLLPAIGSTGALRAAGESSKDKKAASKVPEKEQHKEARKSNPTLDQLRADPPAGAETHAATWTISASDEGPLSDGIWNVFGRVEGAKTFSDGVEVTESCLPEAHQATVAALISRLHTTLSQYDDGLWLPKLQVKEGEVPEELREHLADRFTPKVHKLLSKPIVRLKRGTGEEDDLEVLKSVQAAAIGRVRASDERRKRGEAEEDEDVAAEDMEAAHDVSQPKPKRKRHVAKFNPDGTLKLCQACGTNNTPMWRRGPAGKSSLCNACGAKWKVGRLVVPEHPPTAAIVPEQPRASTMSHSSPPAAEDATRSLTSAGHGHPPSSTAHITTTPHSETESTKQATALNTTAISETDSPKQATAPKTTPHSETEPTKQATALETMAISATEATKEAVGHTTEP